MANNSPENPTQLSHGLPGITRYITGHNAEGKAIIESSRPGEWAHLFNDTMAFDALYTTSEAIPNLNDNADIKKHEEVVSKGNLGLVNPGGSVARIVDFGPATEPVIHRTQSLDYGVILEGELEMILDDGKSVVMRRGDMAVQRGTIHGWRNTSKTEWARVFFVLLDCQKVVIDGKEIGEDVSGADEESGRLQSGKQ